MEVEAELQKMPILFIHLLCNKIIYLLNNKSNSLYFIKCVFLKSSIRYERKYMGPFSLHVTSPPPVQADDLSTFPELA